MKKISQYWLLIKKRPIFHILLVGALLRFYKIGQNDFWYDEAYNIIAAGQLRFLHLKDTLTHIYREGGIFLPTPPLFFFLLRVWILIFPMSEITIRMFSALLGVFSIFLIYKISKKFLDPGCSTYGTLIYALAPLQIWYAQEIAPYQVAIFLVLFKFYFFLAWLKEDKKSHRVGYILSSLLLIYTNYYGILLFIPELFTITFIFRKKRILGTYLIYCVFILIGYLPVIIKLIIPSLSFLGNFWTHKPTYKSLIIAFENFNLGYTPFYFMYKLALIIFWGLILYTIRRFNTFKLILLTFFISPILLVFVFKNHIPYLDRQLMFFSPFYYLLSAWGLSELRKKKLCFYLIFLTFLITFFSSLANYYANRIPYDNYLHHFGVHLKKPFKPAVKFIKENFKTGDIIAHTNMSTRQPFVYYWDKSWTKDLQFHQLYFSTAQQEPPYFKLIVKKGIEWGDKTFIYLTPRSSLHYQRIWLISSSWNRDGTLDENSTAVKDLIENHYNYNLLQQRWFDGILIELYEKNIGSLN